MITISNLGMQFGGQWLFQHVDLQFLPGNCYGIIGANGAGKSTFLRILYGELDSTTGSVTVAPNLRVSVLKQNQNAYDEYSIMDTVIMGNQHLYDVMKEKDAIYEKPDFSDEDGLRAADLEAEFAELGGWEAESDASRILQGLGVPTENHYDIMGDTDPRLKVKVLLAQALFGNPDIVMLDEPTNNLDIESINWLEDFLLDFPGMVIAVSHDRHFLNTVCTHTVDIDYGKIKMYVGNYDFWYESSQMVQAMLRNKNKRNQEKIEELQLFIQRFSANKAKAKQATARRKLLDKLTVEEMPCSSRRYPWVSFKAERELGKDVLTVKDVSVTVDGEKLLDGGAFPVNRTDKIAFVGENELARRPLCSRSSWANWSRTRAPSKWASPPPAATCPRTIPPISRATSANWWTGCGNTPPRRMMCICVDSSDGCCSPARMYSRAWMCSPAAKKYAACCRR